MDPERGGTQARGGTDPARPASPTRCRNRRNERALRHRHLLRARKEGPMSSVEKRQEVQDAGRDPVPRMGEVARSKGKAPSGWRGLIALIVAIGGGLALHLVVGKNEPLQK